MAGGDVEEHQLIGPGGAVAAGQLDGITGIAKADKVHPLHHPTVGHIQAGNDPFGNHEGKACSGLAWRHFFVAPDMSQAAITVGSKVRVTRVRDRIPADLVSALQSDATGTVKDFKVTDGKGIGVVVELSNGTTTWFFDDEITAA